MLKEKYILIENFKNANSVNLLWDLKFVASESVWTAEFNSGSVKLKTIRSNGETCELTGNLEKSIDNFNTYSEYFKKPILTVYQITRSNFGAPYGAHLIIFNDNSTGWIGYGSGMRYVDISLGYLDNTNTELAKTIGWF